MIVSGLAAFKDLHLNLIVEPEAIHPTRVHCFYFQQDAVISELVHNKLQRNKSKKTVCDKHYSVVHLYGRNIWQNIFLFHKVGH